MVYRIDGRQVVDVFTTPEAATRHKRRVDSLGGAAARAMLALEEEHGVTPADVTLAEHAAAYVQRLDGITAGTRRDYDSMVSRRLAGTPLGDLPLRLVTRDAISAWQRELEAGGMAAKTRRNYHSLVSAALADAVDRGLRPDNPARGIRVKADRATRDKVFLNQGELAVLIAAIPTYYQPLVITLAGTGLRFGEATALQVGDVDLDSTPAVLHVRRAWKRTGAAAKEIGTTKTSAGERTIGLPPQVSSVLAPLVEGRRRDALLFTTPSGSEVRNHAFHSAVWKPTLDRLNAEEDADGNPITPRLSARPRIHDLRHGHASQLIRDGVPLNVVQRRLGHESIQTTVGVYGHMAPDYLEVSAAAAGRGLVLAVPEIES